MCITNRIWVYTTIKRAETRNKHFLLKNDEDVGMKKAQKQDVIQDGRILENYTIAIIYNMTTIQCGT